MESRVMAEITTEMVKELRAATNAGVLDCRKALTEADGNFEKAVDILRKKGVAKAGTKGDRAANEGLIGTYIHPGSRQVGLVELNCESDFVARNEKFQELARDLAMHVVAARPLYLSKEEVPAEAVEKEKEIYRAQLAESNKPAAVIEKILDGKLEKWYSEVCLLEQPFVKDPDVVIRELVLRTVATLGENMRIRRFVRFEVGA